MKFSIYLNRRVFVMEDLVLVKRGGWGQSLGVSLVCQVSAVHRSLFTPPLGVNGNPVSILYKSIAGRYRPVRLADGPITARYIFIKDASWKAMFSDCGSSWTSSKVTVLHCLSMTS